MRPPIHLLRLALIGLAAFGDAAVVTADPATCAGRVHALKPGDTLSLEGGTYKGPLNLTGLKGAANAWITIQGPADGSAMFLADPRNNTVDLTDCRYIAVKNLTLDGRGTVAAFGVCAKGGNASVSHDILIEGLTIKNYDGGQQITAISTKCTAWNWTIRGNRILSAGTGLYLGNSDGESPFINGVIEGNLVQAPIGYCMQIKHQNARPAHPAMPTGPSRTIIRHNVFIKSDRPSPDGNRPNVLLGGFPDVGPGSTDLYEVYGNVFAHNGGEPLLQASGRFTIHDNIFLDAPKNAAISCVKHMAKDLKLAHIYNNTVVSAAVGIQVGAPAESMAVVANLIFAGSPLTGTIKNQQANECGSIAEAGKYLVDATAELGKLNAYPKAGKANGPAYSLAAMVGETACDLDFNGEGKGAFQHRGAYAGSGTNPGWKLAAELKPKPESTAGGKRGKRPIGRK